MKMQVIKNKLTSELQQDNETLRAQLFALRIQKVLGKLEEPHKINNLRKDIARIKTELSVRIIRGEKIQPLNINKIVLTEDKKEIKKTKPTKEVKNTEILEKKAVTKKVVTDKKTTKPKTTTAKSTIKTSSSKKTIKPQEDKA